MRIKVGILAAGLVALAACRDEIQSPTVPESPGTEAAPALAVPSGSWSTRAPFEPSAPACCHRSEYTVGMAPNSAGESIVYVLGGEKDETGDGDVRTGWPTLRYNATTNSWFATGPSVHAADLNGVGKIGNKLYLTGGVNRGEDDANFAHIWNRTYAYNVSTQSLSRRTDMPVATFGGVTGVINNQLYVLPGRCSGRADDPGHCDTDRLIRALYRYDPPSNSWSTRQSAPHFHYHGAAAVLNNKLYVVGGVNGTTKLAHLDVYDPSTKQWQTKAPIPTPGTQLFGAALLGRFYVISWSTGNVRFYSYDPATNNWTPRAAPPAGVGPIVRVLVNGQSRLFMPLPTGHSYLYTP